MDDPSPWPDDPDLHDLVAVLKAVADPTRCRLLWALQDCQMSVGQLAELLGAHIASVSQHLARLRAVGLVVSRRRGNHMIYRLADGHVRALLHEALLAARVGHARVDRRWLPLGSADSRVLRTPDETRAS